MLNRKHSVLSFKAQLSYPTHSCYRSIYSYHRGSLLQLGTIILRYNNKIYQFLYSHHPRLTYTLKLNYFKLLSTSRKIKTTFQVLQVMFILFTVRSLRLQVVHFITTSSQGSYTHNFHYFLKLSVKQFPLEALSQFQHWCIKY